MIRHRSSLIENSTPHRGHSRQRRGAALIYVLILMLFLSMLGISLARLAIAQHRQQQRGELRVQTARLAEAGWLRALHQVRLHSEYPGETWELSAAELNGKHSALIRIELLPEPGAPQQKRLRVTAEYPVDSPHVNRITREDLLPLPN